MKKIRMSKVCAALTTALMISGAGTACAATTTQNITFSGTLAPPPVSCTFSGASNISFAAQTSASMINAAPISVNVTCSSGAAYTFSASTHWTSLTIGGVAAGGGVFDNGGRNLYNNPISATGNGSAQSYQIIGRLGGASAGTNLDPTMHFGAISGTLPMVVSY